MGEKRLDHSSKTLDFLLNISLSMIQLTSFLFRR